MISDTHVHRVLNQKVMEKDHLGMRVIRIMTMAAVNQNTLPILLLVVQNAPTVETGITAMATC